MKAHVKSTLLRSAPALSTVKNCVVQFERDRTSMHDKPRSGVPKMATAPGMIEKVHRIVLDDRRVKVCEIVGILNSSVHIILPEHTVPRLLTLEQKTESFEYFSQILLCFQCNLKDFLNRF